MSCEDISSAKSNWDAELAQCIQHSTSLKQLTLNGYTEYTLQNFKLLTDSLMTNTSIKSVVYELAASDGFEDFGVHLSDVCKAIEKVKENNTLEELTLNKIFTVEYMSNKLFQKIENCVQRINITRNFKGTANLKVNINCKPLIIYTELDDF